MELIVRQSGGGAFLLFENNFPKRHYLQVSLRGMRSNKLGIVARLVAQAAGQQIVRELFPHNTFRSQAPNIVHFGLGDARRVERLTIRWPSGEVQELTDVDADRHIIVTEGRQGPDAVETVVAEVGKVAIPP